MKSIADELRKQILNSILKERLGELLNSEVHGGLLFNNDVPPLQIVYLKEEFDLPRFIWRSIASELGDNL